MKSFIIFAIVIVGALAQSFSFKSNITLSNGNDFKFRESTTLDFSIPLLYSGLYITSLSVDVNPTSAALDGVYGAAYTGLLISPSAFLTFLYSSSQWQVSGSNYAQANASAAAGFIGKVFLSLDEVDSTGKAVATTLFKNLIWSKSDASVGKGGLSYLTVQTSTAGATIKISFIYSDVVGVLNVIGTAVVTPKTLESVVSIQNWKYANNGNSLRLNLVVGTAAGSAGAQGEVTNYVSGNGQGGTFLTLDHVASINGAATPVSISAFTEGQGQIDFGNSYLQAQIVGKYGAGASFKFVSITFPAGSASIVYDPSIGAGASPPNSGAVKTVASFFALIVAFAMFLL